MPETATVLDVGARVGDTYEVVRLLGRGGMGEVWLARHLRLPGKQVAIKVLHTRSGGLSEEQLQRFKREADVATRIGHPNIVEVHDYNTLASGSPYLVLEYLQGESLASRLRFGAVPLDETTLLLRQVSSALDASHRLGVVHRDLKPDNIFLVPTPMGTQVKVLDFGISKVVDSNTLQTADQVLVGTPQYMSPEQAIGQNRDVGPQTDVFALGSIAYEMLSGTPPFTADSVAKVLFRIAYEPHAPLATVKPGLPQRVYQAVERALEKDRAKRFSAIADFIAAFSGQPVPRTLAPPERPGAPSGVAHPGMATPDSLALGVTAAKTPFPEALPGTQRPAPAPSPAAAPEPSSSSAPAPTPSRRGLALSVVALAALCIGGTLVVLRQLQPEVPAPAVATPPRPTPVMPTPAAPEPAPPPEPGLAVKAQGGGEPEPASASGKEPDPGPRPSPRPAPAAVKKAPSEGDLAVLSEMERRLDERLPLRRVRQLFGNLESEPGLQRGYALAALAACKEQDLANARTYLDKLTDRAERQRLVGECKKLGTEVVE